MNVQIDIIAKVNQLADEIIYLQKSRVSLKNFANQYLLVINSNNECINFFPTIVAELKSSLEKKNFNISNAKEKIDTLIVSLKRMEYIKLSIISYDKITDNVIKTRVNLEDFKNKILEESRKAKLESIESVFNHVSNKFIEINSQLGYITLIRDKYNQLSNQINSQRLILKEFVKVESELVNFVSLMSLDSAKVDFYLKTLNDSLSKLNQIIGHIEFLKSLSQDELRCILPSNLNELKQIAATITYDTISHNSGIARSLYDSITNNINLLKNLRANLTNIKAKIITNKNSIYNSDYDKLLVELAKIEPLLYSNLNANFNTTKQLIHSLENNVNLFLNNYTTMKSKAQQLNLRIESAKRSYWLEDYKEIKADIFSFEENQSAKSYNLIIDLIDSKSQVKRGQIERFVSNNNYLLSNARLIEHINTSFLNQLVSKNDFITFAESTLKWKGLKIALYKIRAILIYLGKIIIKPSTIKYGAIILGVCLGLFFIISFWKEILIIIIVILIIIGIFNSKK